MRGGIRLLAEGGGGIHLLAEGVCWDTSIGRGWWWVQSCTPEVNLEHSCKRCRVADDRYLVLGPVSQKELCACVQVLVLVFVVVLVFVGVHVSFVGSAL